MLSSQTNKAGLTVLVWLLFVCAFADAQDPVAPPVETNSTASSTSTTGVYSGRELYVPKPVTTDTQVEPVANSIANAFLRNSRQHIGFSVSLAESYSPNTAVSTAGKKESMVFTSLVPQIYLNVEKKRLAFRLTYGITYNRTKVGEAGLNRGSQNGNASITYTIPWRKSALTFSDNVNSSYYDLGSNFGLFSPGAYYRADLTPTAYLDRRRENRNNTSISWSYTPAKSLSFNTGVNYDIAQYSGLEKRPSMLTGSISMSYHITKWLYFNSQYSHHLNTVDPGFRGNTVEDLRVGGFSFKPGRGWVISTSGGVDSTKNTGRRYITGSGEASILKQSRHTSVQLSYHRGYSTVFPSSDVWAGDTANAYIVQSIAKRMSIHTNASYMRGSSVVKNSSLTTTYGGAGWDIVLQRSLVFSANYFYVSQRFGEFTDATLHRNTVALQLHYYLPGVGKQ